MGTKQDPGRFDCYAKAEPDEPVFVLLARDPMAAMTVLLWTKLRDILRRTGPHAVEELEKIEEARNVARDMETWAREHGTYDAHVTEVFDEMILEAAEMIRQRVAAGAT